MGARIDPYAEEENDGAARDDVDCRRQGGDEGDGERGPFVPCTPIPEQPTSHLPSTPVEAIQLHLFDHGQNGYGYVNLLSSQFE